MTPNISRPVDLSPTQRGEFIALVHEGAQVNEETLGVLVDRAVALVRLYDGNRLIGTAAIKDPNPNHRRGYFAKAGESTSEKMFPLEMGWIVVQPDYQGKGLARRLIEAAISATADGLYATTKTDKMIRILPDYGFIKMGKKFPSVEDRTTELTLFVRGPQTLVL